MCLITAIGVGSTADRLNDVRIENCFLPGVDGGQAKIVIVGIA